MHRALTVFTVLALIAVLWTSAASAAVTFEQLSWLDESENWSTRYSDWGRVTFDYNGTGIVCFFNLVTGGHWSVQNAPVLSPDGPSTYHQASYLFDLEIVPGTPVTAIEFTYTISTTPLSSPPMTGARDTAPVTETKYSPGGSGNGIKPAPGDAGTIVAHPAGERPRVYVRRGLRAIEQHWNHCAPGAMASSLMWLNDEHSLGFPDALDSARELYDELRNATNLGTTEAGGTYLNRLASGKRNMIEEHTLPVKVEVNGTDLGGGEVDPEWLVKQIKKGQDVELEYWWSEDGREGGHTVAVNGVVVWPDGTIGVGYVHDREQKETGDPLENGGTGGFDVGLITPRTGGGYSLTPAAENTRIRGFVAESPIIPQESLNNFVWRYDADGTSVGGEHADDFEEPYWLDDQLTLHVDNNELQEKYKRLYLLIMYTEPLADQPVLSLTTASGMEPSEVDYTRFNDDRHLLVTWILPDQPAWEQIRFPSEDFANLEGVDRIFVSFLCSDLPCETPGSEPSAGDDTRASSTASGAVAGGGPVSFCRFLGDSADPGVTKAGLDVDMYSVEVHPESVLIVWQDAGMDGVVTPSSMTGSNRSRWRSAMMPVPAPDITRRSPSCCPLRVPPGTSAFRGLRTCPTIPIWPDRGWRRPRNPVPTTSISN
ncbi:hypothetical protein JW905_14280 [bacterium]|nr:hypothetical protein [candidate division CSSED10-310 bacterium]